MATGRLIRYLGVGLAAERPADPDAYDGTLALWFATDTGVLSAWDGSTWYDAANVDSITAITPSGGFADGILLVYDEAAGAFVELPRSTPGYVLTETVSGPPDWQPAAGAPVVSVNGFTGAVVLALGNLDDVLQPSGDWSDGALLVYDAGTGQWVEQPPGDENYVLTIVSGVPTWAPAAAGGDVFGPGASVDNTVPRFVGTAGDEIEDTGVVISDNDEISGYRGLVDRVTASSYALQLSDTGRIKELSDGSGVTCNLDREMPKGFACTVVQWGAGVVNFVPESGATLVNRQGHTDTAGQYAEVFLYVSENSGGSAAVWVLGGDTQ